MTAENFRHRNDYRNPAIAAALKTLGYVNRFGRGIALIDRALEQNGNPPPEYQIESEWWGVIVRSAG
ncbi:MAG: ATP-binding protein [Mycobacteriales bacterium]